jgi:hypothetical protein
MISVAVITIINELKPTAENVKCGNGVEVAGASIKEEYSLGLRHFSFAAASCTL